MPCNPLRSVFEPIEAIHSAMVFLSASSSVDCSVMIPSPFNAVLANIATLSSVSATDMLSFSSPRLERICLADASNLAPSGFSVLKAEKGSTSSFLSNRSGSFMIDVIHWAASTTSFTWIRPSLLLSSILRVFSSNSSPVTGLLNTVHNF